MRVRFSTCKGTNILCDSINEVLGQITGILLNPDTGKVEGFFAISALPMIGTPFLSTIDITKWGAHVHVRETGTVFPLEDHVRLQPLLEDNRTILGQRIRTESGRKIGVCHDVQFNSDSMRCEWLFPRRFWRWCTPIPFSDVLEVRQDAIIVRDPNTSVKDPVQQESPLEILQQIPGIGSVPEN